MSKNFQKVVKFLKKMSKSCQKVVKSSLNKNVIVRRPVATRRGARRNFSKRAIEQLYSLDDRDQG
jgi:hypothetical protein